MWKRIRLTLEMIKFEHSVFAMPFALTGALLAIRHSGLSALAAWGKIGWIVVAMVGARSAAMAFNRLIDARIDARNPRTRMRHLPAGVLSRGFTWGFVTVSALVFLFAAGALDPLCFCLAPAAVRRGGVCFVIRSPNASPRSRTWCWDSRWAWRRRRPGSPSAARSIRASSGSQ